MATVVPADGSQVHVDYAEGSHIAELVVESAAGHDSASSELGAAELDVLAAHFRHIATRIRANGGS